MVVERHASVDLARRGLVEIDGDCDCGLARIADDFGPPPGHRFDLDSECAQQRFILGVRADRHAYAAGCCVRPEPHPDAERAQSRCETFRVVDLEEQEIAAAWTDSTDDRRTRKKRCDALPS